MKRILALGLFLSFSATAAWAASPESVTTAISACCNALAACCKTGAGCC